MITNSIKFEEPEKALVDNYNSTPVTQMDHRYWEVDVVTPVRSKIKLFYEREQSFRCCYCDVSLPTTHGRAWDAEHVVPKSTHPQFLFEPLNLAASCIDCNDAKKDIQVLVNPRVKRYPVKSEAYKIIHPHFDNLTDHLSVFLEKIYVPKSDKGAFTYNVCKLSRFAYKHSGYVPELSSDERLVMKVGEKMEANNKDEIDRKVMELLMIAQVRVSKSLL